MASSATDFETFVLGIPSGESELCPPWSSTKVFAAQPMPRWQIPSPAWSDDEQEEVDDDDNDEDEEEEDDATGCALTDERLSTKVLTEEACYILAFEKALDKMVSKITVDEQGIVPRLLEVVGDLLDARSRRMMEEAL